MAANGSWTYRMPAPAPPKPDCISAIHEIFDCVSPRSLPESTQGSSKDFRLLDILRAHTLSMFGAIAQAIGEHPGFEARCEEEWRDRLHVTGLRWRWSDGTRNRDGYIEVSCDRDDNASWFHAELDGHQVGNKIRWPLSSLNSDVTLQIAAHLIRERIHP